MSGLHKNFCCDPSSEPCQHDGSDEGSQNWFQWEMRKIITLLSLNIPLIYSSVIVLYKVSLKHRMFKKTEFQKWLIINKHILFFFLIINLSFQKLQKTVIFYTLQYMGCLPYLSLILGLDDIKNSCNYSKIWARF